MRAQGALVLALALASSSADAYTVGTPVTEACHESITEAGLRAARSQSPAAAPLPLVTSDDAAMASDLPFEVASDMGDLGAIALLLGVRDNDLKGYSPTDLGSIAIVQSDPGTQDEHCLRSLEDLEPNGTPNAIAACRSFILGRVALALTFLGPDGAPDANARTGLLVSLAIRGQVTIPLPGFYVAMGQALHALQDGFSHSYRDPDGGRITEALDWLHFVDDDLNQAVDGPPHSTGLDRCTSLDPYRAARLSDAAQASRLLLLAALGPGDTTLRLANASAVLDQFLAYEPGCTFANGWCDARERGYEVSPSCAVRSGGGANGADALALLLVGAVLVLRRWGRATSMGVALVGATTSTPVLADTEDVSTKIDASAKEPAPPNAPLTPPSRVGVYLAIGGSFDNLALSVALGGRVWLSRGWLVGWDAELNPWASVLGGGVRPGALNAYGTLIRRWPASVGPVDLRTSLHLGSSTILFDLFGVPKYTTGIYVGANLLGLEWKASRWWSLVLDPADVAFPVPQLHGTPFGYLQYRITLGAQWGA